ncbi:hypothetical protein EG68_07539 [Paragonimus skrjabini miyazakii]|uniref:Uncharacterized protein n=1 Tax=Paragonimus skrjabini miyazakii TaxID=59628 RepID=A0A8S9YKY8_9TREM|nr:hypothetical protein EG68_07539 [Paragonimus skrjabini miyazakii]
MGACGSKRKDSAETDLEEKPIPINLLTTLIQQDGQIPDTVSEEKDNHVEKPEPVEQNLASSGMNGKKSSKTEADAMHLSKYASRDARALEVHGLMNDKFVQFIRSGGVIGDLLELNLAPSGWNENLLTTYPTGCKEIHSKDNHLLYQVTIHVNDEEISTKRHFLAFYQLRLHLMDPNEVIDWCKQHQMYNTVADYIALYIASRFHGPGSMCLRGLASDPQAVKVEMTDRFYAPSGVFRAIVFQAQTMQAARRLVNTYLQRLQPTAFRSVRCGFSDKFNQLDGKMLRQKPQQLVN